MIFGKPNSEKISRSDRIRHMAEHGVTCFALLPTTLANGQYIWLEKYHAKLCAIYITEYKNTWWRLIPYVYRTENYTLEETVITKLKGK